MSAIAAVRHLEAVRDASDGYATEETAEDAARKARRALESARAALVKAEAEIGGSL